MVSLSFQSSSLPTNGIKPGSRRPTKAGSNANSSGAGGISPRDGPKTASKTENVAELDCAICLGSMVDPVGTPCQHVFCRGCLQTCVDAKNDADTGHVMSSGACPLCRFSFPAGFDPWYLDSHAKTLERAENENHQGVIDAAAELQARKRDSGIWLWISNSCSVVRNSRTAGAGALLPSKRRYTLAVHSCPRTPQAGGLISRVVYRLKEGREDRVVQSVSYPFEYSGVVVGDIDDGQDDKNVFIEIHWQKSLKLVPTLVQHTMLLSGRGAAKRESIVLDSPKVNSLLNQIWKRDSKLYAAVVWPLAGRGGGNGGGPLSNRGVSVRGSVAGTTTGGSGRDRPSNLSRTHSASDVMARALAQGDALLRRSQDQDALHEMVSSAAIIPGMSRYDIVSNVTYGNSVSRETGNALARESLASAAARARADNLYAHMTFLQQRVGITEFLNKRQNARLRSSTDAPFSTSRRTGRLGT